MPLLLLNEEEVVEGSASSSSRYLGRSLSHVRTGETGGSAFLRLDVRIWRGDGGGGLISGTCTMRVFLTWQSDWID